MATIPVFRTWVAGEVVTAAYFNANVRDAGNFFLSWPIAELRQTVAQSISSGAYNTINFDTEDRDSDNGHSTVSGTSRYTIQTAGRWQFAGGVSYAANATGRRLATWDKNSGTLVPGSEVALQTIANGNPTQVPTRTITTLLVVNDFMELAAFQDSGVALNTSVSGAQSQCNMSVRMVATS